MLEVKVYQIRGAGSSSCLESRDLVVKDVDPTYDPKKDAETILEYLNTRLPYRTVEELKANIKNGK